jgi:hypothetical protein
MTGPFYKTYGSLDPGSKFYASREWHRQARPYVKPLPYRYAEVRTFGSNRSTPVSPAIFFKDSGSFPYGTYEASLNRAKEKFYGKMGDQSMWAVNLLERKQAVSMIASRCGQVLSFVRALKKLDFKKAAKVLGITKPKGVSRKKQLSNNFLEYHFGWSPMLQDIGAAVKTLQDPLPKRRIRVNTKSNGTLGEYPPPYPPVGQSANIGMVYNIGIRGGCTAVMSNPDLYLANQLGFTNPAGIAWESVPFSFVVDWFLPIGNFLNAMTATLGLDLQNAWSSSRIEVYTSIHETDSGSGAQIYSRGYSLDIIRNDSALSPYPDFVLETGFSPIRAVTSLSLLIQQMRTLR